MKEHFSHPIQMILTTAGFLILAGLAVLYAAMKNPIACLVFIVIAILYFGVNRDAFYRVTYNDAGITQRTFLTKQTFKWENVQEAGVMAVNVVKRKRRDKRPSECRLYYSLNVLTNEERMAASNKPGKHVILVNYTPEKLRISINEWPHRLTLFNVTAKELFGEEVVLPDLNMKEIHY